MGVLNLDLHQSDEIALAVRTLPDGMVELTFAGAIEHPNPGIFLDPLFLDLHTRLLELRVPALRVDFTELAFLNSSGIKALIKWIMRVTDLPAAERYAIEFVYSSEITWQYASLKAITLLSRGAVRVLDRQVEALPK
jgi:hypothetical protein